MTDPTTHSQPAVDPALVARVKGILVQPNAEWLRVDGEFATTKTLFTRYAMILAAIIWYALEYTIPGRKLLFVGRGREVSRLNGINVDRVRATSFVFSGLISAFAGVLYAGMTGSADPLSGLNLLLPAFAAAARWQDWPALPEQYDEIQQGPAAHAEGESDNQQDGGDADDEDNNICADLLAGKRGMSGMKGIVQDMKELCEKGTQDKKIEA